MKINVFSSNDFYEFACGSWIKSHSIPDDDFEVGSFKDLGKDVQRSLRGMYIYYLSISCLNEFKFLDLLDSEKGTTNSIRKASRFYKQCMNESMY